MKLLLFIIYLIAFVSCTSEKEKHEDKTTETADNILQLTDSQLSSISMTTEKIDKTNFKLFIKVNGKIGASPQNLLSINAPLGGFLKSTKLTTGIQVKKGDLMAIMEDADYIQLQQDYLITKARLAQAKTEFERQTDLNATKSGSDKIFQQSKADFQSLNIETRGLEEKLKLLSINPSTLNAQNISKSIRIYAPFDGYVIHVNVIPGNYVQPQDVMFELMKVDNLRLNLTVLDKDLPNLKPGMSIYTWSNTNPDIKYSGKILTINRYINQNGTAEVQCQLDKADKNLIPGQYMNAQIETSNNEVYTLPENAVLSYQGKNYIFIQKSKTEFELIEVKTGLSSNGLVEIKQPESIINQPIVIKGAYALLMSLKNKGE